MLSARPKILGGGARLFYDFKFFSRFSRDKILLYFSLAATISFLNFCIY